LISQIPSAIQLPKTLSKDAFQQMQEPAILESEKTKAVLWDVEALANKW
jgi:hypothetical protein